MCTEFPQIFIELEELRHDDKQGEEWEETARWIKFEEDVEEGSGRWGRPHVSALAFHSLVDLRKGLDKGIIWFSISAEEASGLYFNSRALSVYTLFF